MCVCVWGLCVGLCGEKVWTTILHFVQCHCYRCKVVHIYTNTCTKLIMYQTLLHDFAPTFHFLLHARGIIFSHAVTLENESIVGSGQRAASFRVEQ